jgi:hypothetical protein
MVGSFLLGCVCDAVTSRNDRLDHMSHKDCVRCTYIPTHTTDRRQKATSHLMSPAAVPEVVYVQYGSIELLLTAMYVSIPPEASYWSMPSKSTTSPRGQEA